MLYHIVFVLKVNCIVEDYGRKLTAVLIQSYFTISLEVISVL